MPNPFKGQTVIQVSSVIYNLAGDMSNWTSFVRKTIFQSVFLVQKPEISRDLTSSILSSKGFNLRHYIYWLIHTKKGKKYKELAGYKASELSPSFLFDEQALAMIFKPEDAEERKITCVAINNAEITSRNPSWWGGVYLASEHPGYENYDFNASVSAIENGQQALTVTVQVPQYNQYEVQTGTSEETFTAQLPLIKDGKTVVPLCDPEKEYLCVQYQLYSCADENNDNTDDAYAGAYAQWEADAAYAEREGLGLPAAPVHPEPGEDDAYHYFIYEQGSEPDSVFEEFFPKDLSSDATLLVPPIAFRLNNHELSELAEDNEQHKELYKLSKRAYQKVYGLNAYKKMDEAILDNDHIRDIDYAYLFFGVPINTKMWFGQAYLYNFFKMLHDMLPGSETPNASVFTTRTSGKTNQFYVKANKHPLNFSYTISWDSSQYLPNQDIPSKAKFEKKRKYTSYYEREELKETRTHHTEEGGTETYEVVVGYNYHLYLVHKISKDKCSIVRFTNLTHENHVYDWHSVTTTVQEAFSSEDESSFLVPIHEGVFKSLSALTQAELGETFGYLVFNCYESKKLKWYQTSAFRSFMTIVPLGIAPIAWSWSVSSNIAAQAAAQGTTVAAMSSAQISSIVMASLKNTLLSMLAAIAVSKIVELMLKPVLGNQMAGIFGSLAGALAGMYVVAGFDFSKLTEGLMKAKNLIALSVSTLKGYNQGLAQDMQEMLQQGARELQDMQEQTKALQEEYASEFINVNMWANESLQYHLQTTMSPERYFDWTLMRGAEIAERTLDFTVNFPEYSTRTFLATE